MNSEFIAGFWVTPVAAEVNGRQASTSLRQPKRNSREKAQKAQRQRTFVSFAPFSGKSV
jgi:hypothetical protein